jgi:hypothetical protein
MSDQNFNLLDNQEDYDQSDYDSDGSYYDAENDIYYHKSNVKLDYQRKTNFQDIPNDLLSIICKYLKKTDIINFFSTNKTLHYLYKFNNFESKWKFIEYIYQNTEIESLYRIYKNSEKISEFIYKKPIDIILDTISNHRLMINNEKIKIVDKNKVILIEKSFNPGYEIDISYSDYSTFNPHNHSLILEFRYRPIIIKNDDKNYILNYVYDSYIFIDESVENEKMNIIAYDEDNLIPQKTISRFQPLSFSFIGGKGYNIRIYSNKIELLIYDKIIQIEKLNLYYYGRTLLISNKGLYNAESRIFLELDNKKHQIVVDLTNENFEIYNNHEVY